MAVAGQLEQALLNLLKNAAEATAGTVEVPRVNLSARQVRGGRLLLTVCCVQTFRGGAAFVISF